MSSTFPAGKLDDHFYPDFTHFAKKIKQGLQGSESHCRGLHSEARNLLTPRVPLTASQPRVPLLTLFSLKVSLWPFSMNSRRSLKRNKQTTTTTKRFHFQDGRKCLILKKKSEWKLRQCRISGWIKSECAWLLRLTHQFSIGEVKLIESQSGKRRRQKTLQLSWGVNVI